MVQKPSIKGHHLSAIQVFRWIPQHIPDILNLLRTTKIIPVIGDIKAISESLRGIQKLFELPKVTANALY